MRHGKIHFFTSCHDPSIIATELRIDHFFHVKKQVLLTQLPKRYSFFWALCFTLLELRGYAAILFVARKKEFTG